MIGKPKREFVDTNVLVYAHDNSGGIKRERAMALIERLWESGGGCLSLQVLQEFYVKVTHKVAQPVDSHKAAEIIAALAAWTVHSPDVDDMLAAIELQQKHQLSFWDAMILNSAKDLGCETVWSEDLNPGQQFNGLTIANPFA
jgi:predicted nucleic acid-binding protein